MPTVYAATDAFSAQSPNKEFSQSPKYERNGSTAVEAKIGIPYTLFDWALTGHHRRGGFATPAFPGSLDRWLCIKTFTVTGVEGSFTETTTINRFTGIDSTFVTTGTPFGYAGIGYIETSDVVVEDSETRYERVVTHYREADEGVLTITTVMTDPMTIEHSWAYALALVSMTQGGWDGVSNKNFIYNTDGSAIDGFLTSSTIGGVAGSVGGGLYYSAATKTSYRFNCAFPVEFYYRKRTRTYDRTSTLLTNVLAEKVEPIQQGVLFYFSPLGAYLHIQNADAHGRAWTN